MKYISKPTSGSGIVAVTKSKNPLRPEHKHEDGNEIEGEIEESETGKASETLTMFRAKTDH